jgi:RNA polymerase sigma-70 factor (ECF subfamily)
LDDRADDSLFLACRRGDKAAYSTLAQRYYRRIFALCLGILANVHDAEDVAQEALLKGLQNLHELARPERFEPWILRIAKNLCLDVLRRRKRARKLPVEPEPTTGGDTHGNHDLERAIARLPEKLRLPLTMFYFENKDAASVARKLGISPSLAYERIRAARETLHELLIERGTHE